MFDFNRRVNGVQNSKENNEVMNIEKESMMLTNHIHVDINKRKTTCRWTTIFHYCLLALYKFTFVYTNIVFFFVVQQPLYLYL